VAPRLCSVVVNVCLWTAARKGWKTAGLKFRKNLA
jgi:hypothetical protein